MNRQYVLIELSDAKMICKLFREIRKYILKNSDNRKRKIVNIIMRKIEKALLITISKPGG